MWLQDLIDEVNAITSPSKPFNSVNLNLYQDGRQGLGDHSDAEDLFKTDDGQRCILSLSIGSSRNFVLTDQSDDTEYAVMLHDGDLLMMSGCTQSHFKHRVDKSPNEVNARINLTFRHIQDHSVDTLAKCPIRRGAY